MWWAVAVLAAGLGAWLLWSGFRGDRSRGRRRCSACWYDLSATSGLKCPECGREWRHERQLLRDRRSWGRVVLGVLSIAFAAAAIGGERIARYGWVKAAPTWVLVAAFPSVTDQNLDRELAVRLSLDVMSAEDRRELHDRCAREIEACRTETTFNRACRLLRSVRLYDPWERWRVGTFRPARQTGGDARLATALIMAMHSNVPGIRSASAETVQYCGTEGVEAIPALLGMLLDDNYRCWQAAESSLSIGAGVNHNLSFGPEFGQPLRDHDPAAKGARSQFLHAMKEASRDRVRSLRLLRDAFMGDDEELALIGMQVLALMDGSNPETRELLFAALDSSSTNMPNFALVSLMHGPRDERLAAAIRRHVGRSFGDWAVSNAIREWGPGAEQFLPEWLELLKQNENAHRWADTELLKVSRDLGATTEQLRPFAAKMLEYSVGEGYGGISSFPGMDPYGVRACVRTIKALGLQSPETDAIIAGFEKDSRLAIRALAALLKAEDEPDPRRATQLLLDARRLEVQLREEPGYQGSGLSRSAIFEMVAENRISLDVLREALRSGEHHAGLILEGLRAFGSEAAPALPELRALEFSTDPNVAQAAKWTIQHIQDCARLGVTRAESRE